MIIGIHPKRLVGPSTSITTIYVANANMLQSTVEVMQSTITVSPSVDRRPGQQGDALVALCVQASTTTTNVVRASLNGVPAIVYTATGGPGMAAVAVAPLEHGQPFCNSNNLMNMWLSYSGLPGGTAGKIHLYLLRGLSSFTPIDVQYSMPGAAQTVGTATINARVGGVVLGAIRNDVSASQSCTWTGTDTPTEDYDSGSDSAGSVISSTEGSNTITATNAQPSTASLAFVAASFR